MEVTRIGIDLAKSRFHPVGMNDAGKVMRRKALGRRRLPEFLVRLKPALIGMEPAPRPITGRARSAS